jgi:hypothetical protein
MTFRRNLIATVTTSSTPDPLLLALTAPPVPVGFFVGLALSNVFLRGSGGAGGFSYSILTGALPTGCVLNGATGAITGTPSAQGLFSFTAQVQDAASNVFIRAITMRVQSGLFPLAVNPTPAVRTLAYRYQVLMADATGSTAGIAYTIVVGALPAGLAMSGAGVIAGAATAGVGTYYFTVRGTKSGATLDVPMHITVNQVMTALGGSLTVGNALRNMSIGVPVDDFVTFNTGGTTFGYPPYVYTITAGALPAGLSMDSKGRISGTPTAATPVSYAQPTITVTDAAGQSKSFIPAGINALNVATPIRSAAPFTGVRMASDGSGPTSVDDLALFFGAGSDGNFVLNGTNNYAGVFSKSGNFYVPLRHIAAQNITIVAPGVLVQGARDIDVADTFDLSGCPANSYIYSANLDAVGQAAGSGTNDADLGGTQFPVAGANGTTTGAPAQPATPTPLDCAAGGKGYNGGAGGLGTAGAGGLAGLAGSLNTRAYPRRNPYDQLSTAIGPFRGGLAGGAGGGGRGNSGGTTTGGKGGGAGAPAGVGRMRCRRFKTDGTTAAGAINWSGGKGGNGTNGTGAGAGGGGAGSGAGGGFFSMIYAERIGNPVVNLIWANGGDAGAPGLAGGVGGANGATALGADSGVIEVIDVGGAQIFFQDIVAATGTTAGALNRMTL